MNENVYLHAFLLLVICAFGMQTKGRMYIYSFSLVFLINSFGLPLSAVAFFGWTVKKQESVTSLKGHAGQQYSHKKNTSKHGGKATPTMQHQQHTMGDNISVTDPQLGGYGCGGGGSGGLPDYQESNSGSYSTTTTISINKNDLLAGRSAGVVGQQCSGSLMAIPAHTR